MKPSHLSYHISRACLWCWLSLVFFLCGHAGLSMFYILPLSLAMPHLNELRKEFLKWLKKFE